MGKATNVNHAWDAKRRVSLTSKKAQAKANERQTLDPQTRTQSYVPKRNDDLDVIYDISDMLNARIHLRYRNLLVTDDPDQRKLEKSTTSYIKATNAAARLLSLIHI